MTYPASTLRAVRLRGLRGGRGLRGLGDFDWGSIASSLVSTVVQSQVARKQADLAEEQNKLELAKQQAATKQAEAQSAARIAEANAGVKAGGKSALPSWAMPAGIAAAGLVVVMMMQKK